MTTTGNAAAPQFRFACINKIQVLRDRLMQQQQIRIQELRDGLKFEGQEQCDEFLQRIKRLSTISSFQSKNIWLGNRSD